MKMRMAGWSGSRKQRLRYYLLTEEKQGIRTYGLRVAGREEDVSIPDITGSRRAVCRLLRRMIRGGVTPVTARDVVEDWLCGEI